MTSPFQTELRDRAAAHAREWEDARDPSVGLAEVEASVRRRRRGRDLLVGAGSVVAIVAVAGVAYVAAGGGGVPAEPSGSVAAEPSGSVLEALEGVQAGDVVLTVDDELPNPSGFYDPYQVLVFDKQGHQRATIASEDLSAALGYVPNSWPTVTLVAVDARLSRAIFVIDEPTATPQIAMLDLTTGDVVLADPCGSTLNSIDLSPWCATDPQVGSAIVIDPDTGSAIQMPSYQACSAASVRSGGMVMASCEAGPGETYLVTVDPATGEVVSQTSLGIAPIQAPLVVGDSVYVNAFSTEGDQILVGADNSSPQVGGASVAGLAVIGDRLLVRTESDKFGGPSTYGKSLGMWSPNSGEFTKLYTLDDAAAASVTLVPVLP